MSHEYPTREERILFDRGGDVYRNMQAQVRERSAKPSKTFQALSRADREAFLLWAAHYWNADHTVRYYAPGCTLRLVQVARDRCTRCGEKYDGDDCVCDVPVAPRFP